MKDFSKVVACFKALGFRPKIDEFEHRLIIQKAVYLLQLKGVKTGFDYNLYARGPYSPDLAREFFEQRKQFERLETSAKLSSSERQIVQELKELFELKPSMLEVAATYAFFAFQEGQDPLTALKNVKKLKPFYSEAQIAVAISHAKQFLFKPSEKDLGQLKQELALWQAAAVNSLRRN